MICGWSTDTSSPNGVAFSVATAGIVAYSEVGPPSREARWSGPPARLHIVRLRLIAGLQPWRFVSLEVWIVTIEQDAFQPFGIPQNLAGNPFALN